MGMNQEKLMRRLRMAVFGTEQDLPRNEHTLEDLLWHVGELRRDAEAAHEKLDIIGAPRKDAAGGTLKLRGRLEALSQRLDEVIEMGETNLRKVDEISAELDRLEGGGS